MVRCAEERAFIVEQYFRSLSYKSVRETFRTKFPNSGVPSKSVIKAIIDRFRSNFTLEPAKKIRPPKKLTPEKLQVISETLTDKPSTSVRKLAVQTNIPKSTVHRGLKQLKLHPYRVTLVQELKPPDFGKRLHYCKWLRHFVRTHGIEIMNNFFFSDEAWFHRTGYINARMYRFWSSENPHRYEESSLHP
ncbi:hypothetical protein PGB90_004459 [Kerria lacca]